MTSDITIICPNGRQLLCHRAVLASRSKRLALVFSSGDYQGQHLPVSGVDSSALEAVIHSFYTGECPVSLDTVCAVHDAASKLEVTDLMQSCMSYLQSMVAVDNICAVLAAAQAVKDAAILDLCRHYLQNRLHELPPCPDFHKAPYEVVSTILTDARTAGAPTPLLMHVAAAWYANQAQPESSLKTQLLQDIGAGSSSAHMLEDLVSRFMGPPHTHPAPPVYPMDPSGGMMMSPGPVSMPMAPMHPHMDPMMHGAMRPPGMYSSMMPHMMMPMDGGMYMPGHMGHPMMDPAYASHVMMPDGGPPPGHMMGHAPHMMGGMMQGSMLGMQHSVGQSQNSLPRNQRNMGGPDSGNKRGDGQQAGYMNNNSSRPLSPASAKAGSKQQQQGSARKLRMGRRGEFGDDEVFSDHHRGMAHGADYTGGSDEGPIESQAESGDRGRSRQQEPRRSSWYGADGVMALAEAAEAAEQKEPAQEAAMPREQKQQAGTGRSPAKTGKSEPGFDLGLGANDQPQGWPGSAGKRRQQEDNQESTGKRQKVDDTGGGFDLAALLSSHEATQPQRSPRQPTQPSQPNLDSAMLNGEDLTAGTQGQKTSNALLSAEAARILGAGTGLGNVASADGDAVGSGQGMGTGSWDGSMNGGNTSQPGVDNGQVPNAASQILASLQNGSIAGMGGGNMNNPSGNEPISAGNLIASLLNGSGMNNNAPVDNSGNNQGLNPLQQLLQGAASETGGSVHDMSSGQLPNNLQQQPSNASQGDNTINNLLQSLAVAAGNGGGIKPEMLAISLINNLTNERNKNDMQGGLQQSGLMQQQSFMDMRVSGRGSKSSRVNTTVKGYCHVDGCGADLTGLRDYHQRYKICDMHLKAPSILRDGILQRFCQQCGRFHTLDAFDGTRRSCRAMLQRHNARRNKRNPDALGLPPPPNDSQRHQQQQQQQYLAALQPSKAQLSLGGGLLGGGLGNAFGDMNGGDGNSMLQDKAAAAAAAVAAVAVGNSMGNPNMANNLSNALSNGGTLQIQGMLPANLLANTLGGLDPQAAAQVSQVLLAATSAGQNVNVTVAQAGQGGLTLTSGNLAGGAGSLADLLRGAVVTQQAVQQM